jgi:hypothetical protein
MKVIYDMQKKVIKLHLEMQTLQQLTPPVSYSIYVFKIGTA